jgi:hypothetical protein
VLACLVPPRYGPCMTEFNAVLVFDNDHKMQVAETREQVLNAIGSCTTPHIPLIELRAPNGQPVNVNVNHLRVIEVPVEGATGFI